MVDAVAQWLSALGRGMGDLHLLVLGQLRRSRKRAAPKAQSYPAAGANRSGPVHVPFGLYWPGNHAAGRRRCPAWGVFQSPRRVALAARPDAGALLASSATF